MTQTKVGIAEIVAAFFFVAVMGALSKLAPRIPLTQLTFFQSFVALLLVLPWALKTRLPLKSSHLWLHVARGTVGLLSQLLLLWAVRKIPLMNATLLANSSPLFINLIFWIWLGRGSRATSWLGLALGFIGIVCVLQPSATLLREPASLIALASALCSAAVLVMVDRLSASDPPVRITIYYFMISSLIMAPFMMVQWRSPGPSEWLALVLIGGAMAAAQLLIARAYTHASAKDISAFNYSVVVFAGILGWIFWRDVPDLLSAIGVVLVVLGGVLSVRNGPASLPQSNKRGVLKHARSEG